MKAYTLASAVSVGALAALLARAGLELRTGEAGLKAAVAAELGVSGVSHPVTAVLLNFRSYDTWLELIVLVLAAAGALERFHVAPAKNRLARDPLVTWLLVALVPLMVLAAGYLLKAGAYAPGGAFQAGATLAAALVLLHLAGRPTLAAVPAPLVLLLFVLGAGSFAIAAVAGLALEGALLEYPRAYAGAAILAVETAAMLSIAVALAALVIGQLER